MSRDCPRAEEVPVVFACDGSELLGIVHRPAAALNIGVLTLVAGGPQYRGGCGRQLVSMARSLADAGIPVMRFDHRGLGDSNGDFLGFQHVDTDLRAAINCFLATEPAVEKIVLWGGCDAASAVLINAWRLPEVAGIVLGNPFVSTAETQSAVTRQHYRRRLTQWSFWKKVLSFEYDYRAYARELFSRGGPAARGRGAGGAMAGSSSRAESSGSSYIDRMLAGLQQFDGPVLFLMSGQSLVSKEFDALVARSSAWSQAYGRAASTRIDLPEADQTFSSKDARTKVNESVKDWVNGLHGSLRTAGAA